MRTIIALAAGLFAASALGAGSGEAPAPEEVRKVLDYYYHGANGTPVLVEFKLCEDVHRAGVEKNNCKNEIAPEELTAGAQVYAWMNFMVPRAERGEVLVQLLYDGVIRDTRRADVRGAIRYRTWRRIRLGRAGEWEVPILYDNRASVQPVDTVRFTVHEPLVSRLSAE